MSTLSFGDFAFQREAPRPRPPKFDGIVQSAIQRGFVIGREVMIGKIPGIVVGYNIGAFGKFVGAAYPLVIRTEMGVAKCHPDELTLVGS